MFFFRACMEKGQSNDEDDQINAEYLLSNLSQRLNQTRISRMKIIYSNQSQYFQTITQDVMYCLEANEYAVIASDLIYDF